jgi:hypothetical protein
MDIILPMPPISELKIIEATDVPFAVLDNLRRMKVIPDFYGKLGNVYCVHWTTDYDCGVGFFATINGKIHIPTPEEDDSLEIARQFSDIVHSKLQW